MKGSELREATGLPKGIQQHSQELELPWTGRLNKRLSLELCSSYLAGGSHFYRVSPTTVLKRYPEPTGFYIAQGDSCG